MHLNGWSGCIWCCDVLIRLQKHTLTRMYLQTNVQYKKKIKSIDRYTTVKIWICITLDLSRNRAWGGGNWVNFYMNQLSYPGNWWAIPSHVDKAIGAPLMGGTLARPRISLTPMGFGARQHTPMPSRSPVRATDFWVGRLDFRDVELTKLVDDWE
jgi:hypothetical protein